VACLRYEFITPLTVNRYPAFMDRKSGKVAQKRVWDETRQEFEAKAPEVKEIYDMLG
jgi:hypothetical protein